MQGGHEHEGQHLLVLLQGAQLVARSLGEVQYLECCSRPESLLQQGRHVDLDPYGELQRPFQVRVVVLGKLNRIYQLLAQRNSAHRQQEEGVRLREVLQHPVI